MTRFPDLQTLTLQLTSVFCGTASADRCLTVLDREANNQATTFPSEIVTCRFDDGRQLRLFCKYGDGRSHNADGHRGGVAYEAEVYRHVLQPSLSHAATPRLYGAYTDSRTDETSLILEYLDQSIRVSKTPEPAAMGLAARWIGRFHAVQESRLAIAAALSLKRYDVDYYVGWSWRTSLFAEDLRQRFPWLTTLYERYERFIAPVLAAPSTIIHGEYYPKNILFHDRMIYPVDWETAAIAIGEIDLAALIEGWPAEIEQDCEREYQLARWPTGSPVDFERTLASARLYLQLRWLGEQPDWTIDESSLWRFDQLHSIGERLGLI